MKKFRLLIVFTTFIITSFPLSAMAVSNTNSREIKEIDLATTPQGILFNLDHLKPGDWTTRTLLISNDGKQDFKYSFSNQFLKGSEKLYNELLLKVSGGEGVLYEGKLKDFHKLESRFIKSKGSEELDFHVEMPFELDNEFQGLGVEVKFTLSAEGAGQEAVLPSNGGIKLPNTATGIFNLLVAGAVMIAAGTVLMLIHNRKKDHMNVN